MFTGLKIKLKKGEDYIIVDDGKITAGFNIIAKNTDDTFLVSIPAFEINFYTKDEKAIPEIAHESLNSFFRYWKKIKGDEAFFNQMLHLGFSVSIKGVNRFNRSKRKTHKTEKSTYIKDDNFVLG